LVAGALSGSGSVPAILVVLYLLVFMSAAWGFASVSFGEDEIATQLRDTCRGACQATIGLLAELGKGMALGSMVTGIVLLVITNNSLFTEGPFHIIEGPCKEDGRCVEGLGHTASLGNNTTCRVQMTLPMPLQVTALGCSRLSINGLEFNPNTNLCESADGLKHQCDIVTNIHGRAPRGEFVWSFGGCKYPLEAVGLPGVVCARPGAWCAWWAQSITCELLGAACGIITCGTCSFLNALGRCFCGSKQSLARRCCQGIACVVIGAVIGACIDHAVGEHSELIIWLASRTDVLKFQAFPHFLPLGAIIGLLLSCPPAFSFGF